MDPTTMMPGMQQQQPPQQQQPGMPGQDAGGLSALLQRLSPEQLHQLMGLSSLDQQGSALEQQMAQSHALRKQQMGQQPYGWGAGLANGLSQVGESVHGALLERDRKANIDKQGAGRSAFADLLRGKQDDPAAGLKDFSANATPFAF